MCCYRTHCQRWYMNCLAITCKVNLHLLIVRQRWGFCTPLSSRSRWSSSSKDWDKYFNCKWQNLPRFIISQLRVLWDLLAEWRTCGVVAALTALSHERNSLSALAPWCFWPCPRRSVRAAPPESPAGGAVPELGLPAAGSQTPPVPLGWGFVRGWGRAWGSFFKGNVFYCQLEVGSILLFYMIIVILMNFSVKYKKTYRDQNTSGSLGLRFWGSFHFFPL